MRGILKDKDIFKNLIRIAKALGEMFGPSCEIVLHDLSRPDNSIIYITGDVTGRQVGGPLTGFALGMLRESNRPNDVVGYISHSPNGKTMKSSTIFINDEEGNPIGIFCINFDLDPLLRAGLQFSELTATKGRLEIEKSFPTNTPNLLEDMVHESLQRVLSRNGPDEYNGSINTAQRRDIVADLDRQRAFMIRGSTPLVAKLLGVSRYTIYKDRNSLD
jgi:predicted transcriptional regulator YheO